MKALYSFCQRHSFAFFITLIVLGMAAHVATIEYSPVHWMDEVIINEMGRGGVFHKHETWSMVWSPLLGANERPYGVYYLGGMLLEWGYQLFGHLGPRIVSLSSFLLLAFLVVFYFRKKTGRIGFSYLMGLLCIMAPCLTQSSKGGRVDALSLLWIFAALCLLQLHSDRKIVYRAIFAGVGLFTALSIFTWLPGIMVAPLVFCEMVSFLKTRQLKARQVIGLFIICGVTFIVTVVLVLMPFFPVIDSVFSKTFAQVAAVREDNDSWQWLKFGKAILEVPCVFLLGLIALIVRFRKTWLLSLMAVIVCLISIYSRVYVFRMIFIWPYAIIGLGLLVTSLDDKRYLRAICMLILMVVASFLWSVVLREGTEYFAKPFRNYEFLRKEMEREIGRDKTVYNYVNQTYYIGRELGWRQYRCWGWHETEDVPEPIKVAEFILMEEKWMSDKHQKIFERCGFSHNRLICDGVKQPSTYIEKFLDVHHRLSAYGPFRLFSKNADK